MRRCSTCAAPVGRRSCARTTAFRRRSSTGSRGRSACTWAACAKLGGRSMAITTDKEFAAANARGRKRLRTTPHAVAARYDEERDRIVVELSTGVEVTFPPHDAQGLETAKPGDLAEIAIDPPGFGLHFPRLDADLYLPALLEGLFGSKAWAASGMGQAGGKARTPAKQSASRANGRLGGRPRRVS